MCQLQASEPCREGEREAGERVGREEERERGRETESRGWNHVLSHPEWVGLDQTHLCTKFQRAEVIEILIGEENKLIGKGMM